MQAEAICGARSMQERDRVHAGWALCSFAPTQPPHSPSVFGGYEVLCPLQPRYLYPNIDRLKGPCFGAFRLCLAIVASVHGYNVM